MSCCGQRRQALSSRPQPVAPSTHPPLPTRSDVVGGVTLRYRGLGSYTMRSPRTGRLYACGGAGASLQVDASDVEVLLRTRLFTRG